MRIVDKQKAGHAWLLGVSRRLGYAEGWLEFPRTVWESTPVGAWLVEDPTPRSRIVAELGFVCDDPELDTYTYRIKGKGTVDIPKEIIFSISDHVPVTLYITVRERRQNARDTGDESR